MRKIRNPPKVVAELHESRCLLTAERVDSASAYSAVTGEHADGFSRQPREAGDDAAPPRRAHLPERRVLGACGLPGIKDVDDERDEAPDVVGTRAALGDDGGELGLAPVVFVAGFFDGREVEDGGGEVGEEGANLVEGVELRGRDVVDGAVGRMDVDAAELFFREILECRLLDYRRSSCEKLRLFVRRC